MVFTKSITFTYSLTVAANVKSRGGLLRVEAGTPPPTPPRSGEGRPFVSSSPFPFRDGGWGVRAVYESVCCPLLALRATITARSASKGVHRDLKIALGPAILLSLPTSGRGSGGMVLHADRSFAAKCCRSFATFGVMTTWQ